MELVDVPDSKSGVGNYVPVRPRPSAFLITFTLARTMKIQTITPIINFNAQNSKRTIQNNSKTNSPIRDGVSTAGAWFGFGVGLDFLSRKFQFSKSPFKNSLALNTLLGTGAGTFVFIQDKYKKNN